MNGAGRWILPVCALAFLGAPAEGSTILFSNLVQPGNQYGPDGVGIGHTPGLPGDSYLIYAVPFVPGATALLRSFEVPLGIVSGENQLQAFLMSDSGGEPGSVLESFSLSNLPSPPGPLLTVESTLNPLVVTGQRYWFGVTGGAQTFGLWTLNLFQGDPNGGGASSIVSSGVAGAWTVGSGSRSGALEVMGDPVPEPSYTILVGCVGFLFALTRVGRL
jgi:hypothetical protein